MVFDSNAWYIAASLQSFCSDLAPKYEAGDAVRSLLVLFIVDAFLKVQ
jgi:hypothetical protein